KPAGKPVKPVGKPVKPAGKPVARELLNSNRSNRPVNRSNRPVNRSEPVARENLNLFEFGFEFNRFPPVTGQTGPVNRNRSPAVTGNRLGNKTLCRTPTPPCRRRRARAPRRTRWPRRRLQGS